MNREELSEAIHDLTRTPHMARHALEAAMGALSLHQLGELFDQVADHHDVLLCDFHRRGGRGRRPVR